MTKASFVVSHEIMKRRKPFTDERISIIQVKDILQLQHFLPFVMNYAMLVIPLRLCCYAAA